jgi:hypothetical protein
MIHSWATIKGPRDYQEDRFVTDGLSMADTVGMRLQRPSAKTHVNRSCFFFHISRINLVYKPSKIKIPLLLDLVCQPQ